MNSHDVSTLIRAEIEGCSALDQSHDFDLDSSLVTPRRASVRNTFPHPDSPNPKYLDLWIVLEENPGATEGYIIVFDEENRRFGLASASGTQPIFLGWHGGFVDTLQGM